MSIKVLRTRLTVINMRTRMPFKYGIATLTALPHLFVEVELEVDGKSQWGIAADGMAPKWFTKDPRSEYQDDLKDLFAVVRSACKIAEDAGLFPTVFDLWQQIYSAQSVWATQFNYPPLLWNFGVSLIERGIIDAFCRAKRVNFSCALRENLLGIDLGRMRSDLAGHAPREFLPEKPLRTVFLRHTIGMADFLASGDINSGERVTDGLPQSFDECIKVYGLKYFKIKVHGDAGKDIPRIQRVAGIIQRLCSEYSFTLDGNEQFKTVASFQDYWKALSLDGSLRGFLEKLLFVEQPLHRDVALSKQTADAMLKWIDRPPTIIDESDAKLDSLPKALAMGYVGTSHKNCKGIFKGIANACLIEHHRRLYPEKRFSFSCEDLTNVGPVALLQDLAVAANFGIEHVERNGHHYFSGLSMFPDELQSAVLANHPDLYRKHDSGWAAVKIVQGRIEMGSVIDAPFGVGLAVDTSPFTPLEKYDSNTLDV